MLRRPYIKRQLPQNLRRRQRRSCSPEPNLSGVYPEPNPPSTESGNVMVDPSQGSPSRLYDVSLNGYSLTDLESLAWQPPSSTRQNGVESGYYNDEIFQMETSLHGSDQRIAPSIINLDPFPSLAHIPSPTPLWPAPLQLGVRNNTLDQTGIPRAGDLNYTVSNIASVDVGLGRRSSWNESVMENTDFNGGHQHVLGIDNQLGTRPDVDRAYMFRPHARADQGMNISLAASLQKAQNDTISVFIGVGGRSMGPINAEFDLNYPYTYCTTSMAIRLISELQIKARPLPPTAKLKPHLTKLGIVSPRKYIEVQVEAVSRQMPPIHTCIILLDHIDEERNLLILGTDFFAHIPPNTAAMPTSDGMDCRGGREVITPRNSTQYPYRDPPWGADVPRFNISTAEPQHLLSPNVPSLDQSFLFPTTSIYPGYNSGTQTPVTSSSCSAPTWSSATSLVEEPTFAKHEADKRAPPVPFESINDGIAYSPMAMPQEGYTTPTHQSARDMPTEVMSQAHSGAQASGAQQQLYPAQSHTSKMEPQPTQHFGFGPSLDNQISNNATSRYWPDMDPEGDGYPG